MITGVDQLLAEVHDLIVERVLVRVRAGERVAVNRGRLALEGKHQRIVGKNTLPCEGPG